MLALKNVSKQYGSTRVLTGASIEAGPKDCLCIVGAGGSGKSTIVKLLLRMEDPTSGSVMVDGIDLKAVPPDILQLYRRRTGVIFQEPVLLAHATVRENIALPLELFGAPETSVKRAVSDLLKRLEMEARADMLAGELSVSERALVGIARAIVAAPMIIIADEPLLHLDDLQRGIVTELLTNVHKNGATLILFSEDTETASAFRARTAYLEDGKLVARGRAPAKKAAVSTHNILEEPDTGAETDPSPPKPPSAASKPRESSGRIRITSIGSGL